LAHRAASFLFAVLGVRGLYLLGRAFGTVEWMINFKRRRRFARALGQVIRPLSPAARRKHTREHFMQSRCDKLYYLVFDCIPRDTALASLTISNQLLLDRALAGGNGVYLALCHHGPLHVAAMLMALRGYKVAGVRDRREGAMRRYVQSLYDRKYPEFGRMRVMYADSFPREIYRCLKDGFVLGSAMDVSRVRDSRQRSHEVIVFGSTQVFLTGPLRIAIRCKTPVLQAFVIPHADFGYELAIVETLYDPGADADEELIVDRAITRYARNLEEYVTAHPALLTRT
jgi:lauroyl/myristoyl acyltransferase